jgi:hypothetical protein
MKWIQKNFKTLIYIAFLVPILTVAFVSISHVTKWYGISNPFSWAIYLSIGIEIAALSALAAISANMGKKVYFPFGIVTLIQFIGNVYFAFQYIDVNGQAFKEWVSLVDPLLSFMVEEGDFQGHKRFLAFFAGGMLPLISLSFLHMLVKFEEDEKRKVTDLNKEDIQESFVEKIYEIPSSENKISENVIKEEKTIDEVLSTSSVEVDVEVGSVKENLDNAIEIPTEPQIQVIENAQPQRKTLTYTK